MHSLTLVVSGYILLVVAWLPVHRLALNWGVLVVICETLVEVHSMLVYLLNF